MVALNSILQPSIGSDGKIGLDARCTYPMLPGPMNNLRADCQPGERNYMQEIKASQYY